MLKPALADGSVTFLRRAVSVDRVAGDGGGDGGGGASRVKWRVTDSDGTSEVCVWRMRWSDMHACLCMRIYVHIAFSRNKSTDNV